MFSFFTVAPMLKRPRTPPATLGMVDYQNPDHEQLMKRLRPAQSVEEVTARAYVFVVHGSDFGYISVVHFLLYFTNGFTFRLLIQHPVSNLLGRWMTSQETWHSLCTKALLSQAWIFIPLI